MSIQRHPVLPLRKRYYQNKKAAGRGKNFNHTIRVLRLFGDPVALTVCRQQAGGRGAAHPFARRRLAPPQRTNIIV
jgi:hypothetical protein